MARKEINFYKAGSNGMEQDKKNQESRYSVVIASAKRARQLIDGEEATIPHDETEKPLSIAIDELNQNMVAIKKGSMIDDEPTFVKEEVDPLLAAFKEESSEDDIDDTIDDEEEAADSEDDYKSDSEA